jgi:hypothetical protein
MKNYTNSAGWSEIYIDLQDIAEILFDTEDLVVHTSIFNIFKKKKFDDYGVKLKDCLKELQLYDSIMGPPNIDKDKLNSLCELAVAMASYNISLITVCMNLSLKQEGGEYAHSSYLKDLREIDGNRKILALKKEYVLAE